MSNRGRARTRPRIHSAATAAAAALLAGAAPGVLPLARGAGAVVTDGTVGPARALAGPTFAVTAGLGQQRGGNLFHSFSRFDLQKGEAAEFSGPASVHNVLARVTGGPSNVDGTIRCTIPAASFYLINPAGVVFGPNAALDVQGSFAVTTADVVKLADGGAFHATNPAASVLTTAAPAAFGFLGPRPAAVTVQGQAKPDNNANLVRARLRPRRRRRAAGRGGRRARHRRGAAVGLRRRRRGVRRVGGRGPARPGRRAGGGRLSVHRAAARSNWTARPRFRPEAARAGRPSRCGAVRSMCSAARRSRPTPAPRARARRGRRPAHRRGRSPRRGVGGRGLRRRPGATAGGVSLRAASAAVADGAVVGATAVDHARTGGVTIDVGKGGSTCAARGRPCRPRPPTPGS